MTLKNVLIFWWITVLRYSLKVTDSLFNACLTLFRNQRHTIHCGVGCWKTNLEYKSKGFLTCTNFSWVEVKNARIRECWSSESSGGYQISSTSLGNSTTRNYYQGRDWARCNGCCLSGQLERARCCCKEDFVYCRGQYARRARKLLSWNRSYQAPLRFVVGGWFLAL